MFSYLLELEEEPLVVEEGGGVELEALHQRRIGQVPVGGQLGQDVTLVEVLGGEVEAEVVLVGPQVLVEAGVGQLGCFRLVALFEKEVGGVLQGLAGSDEVPVLAQEFLLNRVGDR